MLQLSSLDCRGYWAHMCGIRAAFTTILPKFGPSHIWMARHSLFCWNGWQPFHLGCFRNSKACSSQSCQGGDAEGQGGDAGRQNEQDVDGPAQDLPILEELSSTNVPSLKWCPKAREMTSLWSRLSEKSEDVKLWTLVFMLVRCILPAGRGPRTGDAYSMARIVRERLRRWRAGEYLLLWQEATELTKMPKRRGRKRKEQE